MDDLNCLICSGQVFTFPDNQKYIADQEEHCQVMWKLLELQNSSYQPWVSNDEVGHYHDHDGSFFCYGCNKMIEKVSETMQKLEKLQAKLQMFRQDIEQELVKSYRLRMEAVELGSQHSKSDEVRYKIAIDLMYRNQALLSTFVKQEEEFSNFTIANISTVDSPSCNWEDTVASPSFDHSPASASPAPSVKCFHPSPVKPPSLKLVRIDEQFPELKNQASIKIPLTTSTNNYERVYVRLDSGVTPTDPKDANTYKTPSRCRIPGCKSSTVFSHKSKLSYHIKEVHLAKDESTVIVDLSKYSTLPTKCLEPGCAKKSVFKNIAKLKRHLMFVHDPSRVKEDPSQHIWNQIVTYPAECPIEGCKSIVRLFRTKYSLQRHIMRTHQKLRRPEKIHILEYPAPCYFEGCPKDVYYKNGNQLKIHIRKTHRKRKPSQVDADTTNEETDGPTNRVICEVCGVHVSLSAYESHMRIHSGDMLTCTKCDAKYRSLIGLKEHYKNYHSESPETFQCPNCPKMYKIKSLLTNHIWKKHSNKSEKNKFCPVCNEAFAFNWELDKHKRWKHHEELSLEAFQCTICKKMFSSKGNLTHHMKNHLGTDRFHCQLCQYHTNRNTDFQEHMDTVHCPDFPHICEVCGKGFKLKRRLMEHVKYHEENYPFQCKLCDRRCSNGATLKVHLKKKHSKEDLDKEMTEDQQLDLQGYEQASKNLM